MQLFGAHEGGQGQRDTVERAGGTPGFAFGGLQYLPAGFARAFIRDAGEDMGVAGLHLVGDGGGHVMEREMPGFLGDAGVEHHLQQQIAQFVPQRRHIFARDGVGDLIGLLDGIGRDGGKALRHIPFAAPHRIAQPRHDGQQAV